MSTSAYNHISLNSRDAVPIDESGFLRFELETPIQKVEAVQWLAMETSHGHALTIGYDSSCLYFSEELEYYRADLPIGAYTTDTLLKAIECSMRCATLLHGTDRHGPRNQYRVSILADSGRLCISSDGVVSFAIHTYESPMTVHNVRPVDDQTCHVTVSGGSCFSRGAVASVCCPGRQPVIVQVLEAFEGSLVITAAGKSNGIQLPSVLYPWSSQRSIARYMGLGTQRDIGSSTPVPLASVSSPLSGRDMPADSERIIHVCASKPHGCSEGDVVSIECMERSVITGIPLTVKRVVSEQQLELGINVDRLGALRSREPLTLENNETSFTIRPVVCTAISAGMNRFDVSVRLDEALPEGISPGCQWRISSTPSSDLWNNATVTVLAPQSTSSNGTYNVILRMHFPRPQLTPDSCLRKHSVVGPTNVGLLRDRVVTYMRLRMGRTEAYGMTVVKPNNLSLFGRAQLRKGGILTSTDQSVVGVWQFYPPVARVPFIDIALLGDDGTTIDPSRTGNYSILLRYVGSA